MNSSDGALDRAFAALADPVRRAIIARLSRGPATLGQLAEPFAISLQAVSKHISVLEDSGLVWRTREAQRKPVHLDAAALERLTSWIDGYRLQAEAAYRRLDTVLAASVPQSLTAPVTEPTAQGHPRPEVGTPHSEGDRQ